MPTELGDFHHPILLNKPDFEEKMAKCIRAVEDGLPPKNACILVWGIYPRTYDKWFRHAADDLEAGFTAEESNLIKLMMALSQKDEGLHRRLIKTATKMAVDDESATMLKFLLETRYDYTPKKRSEVELATKEDTTFNINIVESKPKEDD